MEHGRGFDMRRMMGMSDLLGGGCGDEDDDDAAKGEGAETTRIYGNARAGGEKIKELQSSQEKHNTIITPGQIKTRPHVHTRGQIDQPSLSSRSSFQ
jgi:hypothetical protein